MSSSMFPSPPISSPMVGNRHPGFTPASTPAFGFPGTSSALSFNFAVPAPLSTVPSSSSASKHHNKRERGDIMGEDEIDMSYSKNKRMVHDGFRSLSLSGDQSRPRLTNTPVPQGDLFAEDYPLDNNHGKY